MIVEQNHTYDSYFGRYPEGAGFQQVVRWPRNDAGEVVEPILATPEVVRRYRPEAGEEPLSNGTLAAETAYNDGAMTGFVAAQERRGFPGRAAMVSHDGSTAPVLWDLADDFVLFDNYFSSTRGGSLPNMLSLYTGSDQGFGEGTKESLSELAAAAPTTVLDRLEDGGVPWGFYSDQLGDIDSRRVTAGSYYEGDDPTPPILYWAPFLNIPRVWTEMSDRFHTQQQFYADNARGDLPSVSFVLPTSTDHPTNVTAGLERLRSLVNALKKGPGWATTAVFVVWDDWGGFYDHVRPPPGSGFRVPMLLLSPLAKQGHVSSVQHDHASVTNFVLDRFGLPRLSRKQAAAPDFADAFAPAEAALRSEQLSGRELPATPVGTPAQSRATLWLYLSAMVVVAVATVPAVRWSRRSQRRKRSLAVSETR